VKGHHLGLALLVLLLAGVTKLTAQNPVPDGSSIVFGKDQPVANPNGEKFKLSASGTYTIGTGEALAYPHITFHASLVGAPKDTVIFTKADYLNGNWGASMLVAPATWECYGAMFTHKGDPTQWTPYRTAVVTREVK
jgi:hypothetical protein